MLAGIAEATRDTSVDHAKVRHQFNRPIGSFQAVSRRCADMAARAWSATSLTLFAALCTDAGRDDRDYQAAAAKWVAADAATRNAADNIQNLGAIGVTAEHDAHLFFKRARVINTIWGDNRHNEYLLVEDDRPHTASVAPADQSCEPARETLYSALIVMSVDSGITPLAEAELSYLDVMGAAFSADPWQTIEDLRAGGSGRLLRSDRGVELISYEDIGEALKDRRLRTLQSDYWAEHGAGPKTLEFLEHGNLLYFPPDQHLRVRRLMVGAFSASRVEEARREFSAIGDRLVERFIDAGRCDLVWDFTHRYSIEILCRLIEVPAEDVPQFEQATLDLVLLNMRPFENVAATASKRR